MSLYNTSGENLAVTATALDLVFKQAYDEEDLSPDEVNANSPEVFKIRNIQNAAHIEETYAGSGYFKRSGETSTFPQDKVVVANRRTVIIADFMQSLELSKTWFETADLHGVLTDAVAEFGRNAKKTQNRDAFGLYRNAFTTALTNDGQPIIGTHNLIKGGTTTNLLPSSSPLTGTNVEVGVSMMRKQVNQAGIVQGHVARTLLVPTALYFSASRITDSVLVSGSNFNDLNIIMSKYGLKVKTSVYLDASEGGSDTAWFLLSKNHSMTRIIRKGLDTELVPWYLNPNNTAAYIYKGIYSEEYFCSDYSGIVGSTGI